MARQTILSWNIQGQNPLSYGFSLNHLVASCKPDVVCLCEVGEPVLYELFAHEWIRFQAELDAIMPYAGRLDGEGQKRFENLAALVTMNLRFYPGSFGIQPAFIAPAATAPIGAETRRGRFRQVADSLRKSYFSAAIGVRDAHDLLQREIKLLKLELRMVGVTVDWQTPLLQRQQEKHELLQHYSYYVQLVPQENRHYLILRNSPLACQGVHELGGKRPLLCLDGKPALWYLHAIANKHPAKQQIVEVAGMMRSHGAPVVLIGDLNKDRADLLAECGEALADLKVAGCGQPTQKSGGELDYALASGVTALSVERVELVDSDHYPIVVSIDYD